VLELVYNLWLQLSESPALLHLFSFTESQEHSGQNSCVAFALLTQFLHRPGDYWSDLLHLFSFTKVPVAQCSEQLCGLCPTHSVPTQARWVLISSYIGQVSVDQTCSIS
jgi:hypothetical protein